MSILNRRDAMSLAAGAMLGTGAMAGRAVFGQETEKQEPGREKGDSMLASASANPGSFMFTQQTRLELEGNFKPLHITSARDVHGNPLDVRLPTASMRIFRADAGRDEFTQQGGWYWTCGDQQGKAKFESEVAWSLPAKGLGPLVMAVRDREGNVQWFALGFDSRC
jgi:hypothetical protein